MFSWAGQHQSLFTHKVNSDDSVVGDIVICNLVAVLQVEDAVIHCVALCIRFVVLL